MTRTPRLLVVCAGVVVGAVGCSSGGDDAEGDPAPTPDERVSYVSTDIPEDRDGDAVESALGRIDACALIDPQGAKIADYPASSVVEARAPHSCRVTNRARDYVSVALGVELSTDERFTKKLTSVGGAKAYVRMGTNGEDLCRISLPVSFAYSIEVSSMSYVGDRACAHAKSFGALVASRLEDPDEVQSPRGRARWTACDILGPVVNLKRGTEFRSGWSMLAGVDECGVWKSKGRDLGHGIEFEPVAPISSLTIEYGQSSVGGSWRAFDTVRDRRVRVYRWEGCNLRWNEWDAPKATADGLVAEFQVSAPSCKKARRLVADIAEVIDEGRVTSAADPQRPVLYEPDEADSPAVGACADVMDADEVDCEPYADADAPDKGEQTVKAAAADPNVNCAISEDAVQEHFGAGMSPVTAVYGTDANGKPRYACGFVEESHALQVWIVASEDPMNETPGSEIDGHDTHDVTTASEGTREMWVALDDPEQPGHLYAEALVLPSRDHGMHSDSPVNEKPLDKLDEAMSDIVAAHFA